MKNIISFSVVILVLAACKTRGNRQSNVLSSDERTAATNNKELKPQREFKWVSCEIDETGFDPKTGEEIPASLGWFYEVNLDARTAKTYRIYFRNPQECSGPDINITHEKSLEIFPIEDGEKKFDAAFKWLEVEKDGTKFLELTTGMTDTEGRSPIWYFRDFGKGKLCKFSPRFKKYQCMGPI